MEQIYRRFLAGAILATASVALGAQEGQTNPYEGTSAPPQDEITVSNEAQPKPHPGKPAVRQSAQPAAQQRSTQQPLDPTSNAADPYADENVVQVATEPEAAPAPDGLKHRLQPYDPDGDIVHPDPLKPGQLGEGTTIRVRLLGRISTAEAVSGQRFQTRVASDVLQGGQILIPAGAEIDGHIYQVSTGTAGGHGSMRLRPEIVILPDGSRYRLYAQVTGAPGSKTRVENEGVISAGSRAKRDGIEYGSAMGVGAITGAYMAGPVGALAGTLVGAGIITAHLLISHPQATLETGTPLLFTLTQRLSLVRQPAAGGE